LTAKDRRLVSKKNSTYCAHRQTIDAQMVDFNCPRATSQFWTAVLFPAVKP
jgi:hypothetical protein